MRCSSTTPRWLAARCASCGATATLPSASRVGQLVRAWSCWGSWQWGGAALCPKTKNPPGNALLYCLVVCSCRGRQHLHQEPGQVGGQQSAPRHLLRLWQHPEVRQTCCGQFDRLLSLSLEYLCSLECFLPRSSCQPAAARWPRISRARARAMGLCILRRMNRHAWPLRRWEAARLRYEMPVEGVHAGSINSAFECVPTPHR